VTETATANVLPRLLRGVSFRETAQLERHVALHGPLPSARELDGAAVVALAERSGLRGRGGAGFPTAVKMAAARASRGRAIVVANGCESEPLSAKDALLLHELPHLVLDGAVLAARAVGADQVIVAYEGSSPETRISLEHALAQRRGTARERVRFQLFGAAERFLTGQETSLVSQINGGPAIPSFTPPRPAERGVRRRPTLIQNVETLAHLALIARHGADWYREIGTQSEPGSTLVTVLGAVAEPGVYEIECGTGLERVLGAAGARRGQLAGLLVGGYFGSWLPAAAAGEIALSNAALARYGATLGCGVVVALPQGGCPVAETVRIAIYLATETASQCGPCVHGSAAIARTLHAIGSGRAERSAFADLRRYVGAVGGRGACHLPDGLAHFVATALRTFAGEFEEHAANGPCDACAAPALLTIPAPQPMRA
jgi:NADH:ubiquinone oxidoreductase subunit F (NADH-binding)